MNGKQYVIFNLNNEEYAVDIVKIYEINRLKEFTISRVPKVPGYIEGIINLRGEVVPVVNISKIMGVQGDSLENCSRIIILKIKETLIGVMVNSISEVIEFNDNEISEPHEEIKNKNGCITSIGRKGNRIIFILDLEKVLNIGF